MGISTAALAYVAVGASVAGAGVGVYGAIENSQAQAQAAEYNSDIARQNAAIANSNANQAGLAGEEQAAVAQQKTRAEVGAIKANEAASNVDVSTGSAVDVRSSAAELGELNALTIRSNAAKQAYGYKTEAIGYEEQANLDTSQAANDIAAGEVQAGSTFLGGIGNAGSAWANFQNAGAFNASGIGYTPTVTAGSGSPSGWGSNGGSTGNYGWGSQ